MAKPSGAPNLRPCPGKFVGDGVFLQTPVSCFQCPEPNRYNPELKPQLSCSKQRAATTSNRYKLRPDEGRNPEAGCSEGSAFWFDRPDKGRNPEAGYSEGSAVWFDRPDEGCIFLESQNLRKDGERSRRDAPRLGSGTTHSNPTRSDSQCKQAALDTRRRYAGGDTMNPDLCRRR